MCQGTALHRFSLMAFLKAKWNTGPAAAIGASGSRKSVPTSAPAEDEAPEESRDGGKTPF